MALLQVQGVHHITLNGADRQTSIDFWQGILGMPLVLEQPNLDDTSVNHLYFDPGDSRLITVFTNEDRARDTSPNPGTPGNVHHLAFTVSRVVFNQAATRLDKAGIANTGNRDRGFMDSIYFREPLGQLVELACFKFEPPRGFTHTDVLIRAHKLRVAAGDQIIADVHLADAIAELAHQSERL